MGEKRSASAKKDRRRKRGLKNKDCIFFVCFCSALFWRKAFDALFENSVFKRDELLFVELEREKIRNDL